MSGPSREKIRRRARKIRKAQRSELSTKDYIQRTLVVLIIIVILAAALYYTNKHI